jgi:hypothetical protein
LAMICWGAVAIDFAIGLVMGLSCIKLPWIFYFIYLLFQKTICIFASK